MTNEKILQVIQLYKNKLTELDPLDYCDYLGHLITMLPRMEEFVKEGRREKAFRWLGFVQGVLWTEGVYTIEEMKNHNKPEGNDGN